MPNSPQTPGIVAQRLPSGQVAENFATYQPAYAAHEARVAADRCYFCHDAPCMTACPTAIDIPLFIRQIATGTPDAAAKTIFAQNIMGGMCARVCPTETLCEEVCVRELAEGKPVEIGRLQRFATDSLMAKGVHPFTRAADTGKRVAVVGAGPAGLSCAHRLALHGHTVTVYDRKPKAGGLNEYGIAAYKSTDDFAAREVEWLLKIGGITLQTGKELGRDMTLESLQSSFDAVFLGIGLGGVNALGLGGEDMAGVSNAVDFIADLRQAADKSTLTIGRDVVVIGGGMTAVTNDGAPASNIWTTATRSVDVRSMALNDIARMEVSKVPTPANPADSLAGSINLVSKSAFERSGRQLRYTLNLIGNHENLEDRKSTRLNSSHRL